MNMNEKKHVHVRMGSPHTANTFYACDMLKADMEQDIHERSVARRIRKVIIQNFGAHT